MKSAAAGFPERRRRGGSRVQPRGSGDKKHPIQTPKKQLAQEYVDDNGRARIDAQPEAAAFTPDEVKAAVKAVLRQLRPGVIPEERLAEVRARLCSYTFEALGPQRDEIVVVRSLEMPGAIGTALRDFGDALRSSVQSHVAMMARLVASKKELPDPAADGSLAKAEPTKMVSVRLPLSEHDKLKEEARLRSKTVSQLVRDMLKFTTSAPTEVEQQSEFARWLAERDEHTNLDP